MSLLMLNSSRCGTRLRCLVIRSGRYIGFCCLPVRARMRWQASGGARSTSTRNSGTCHRSASNLKLHIWSAHRSCDCRH